MTNKIRIYDLSKELKKDNKDILEICNKLNILVKNQSTPINEDDANKIRQYINNKCNNSPSIEKQEFYLSSKQKIITKSSPIIRGRKLRTSTIVAEINKNNNDIEKPTKSKINNNKPQIKTASEPPSISIIRELTVKDENIIFQKSLEKTLESNYSNYVPLISFNDSKQQEKANKYISEQVKEFFKFLQKDFKEFSYLEYSKTISDLDFSGNQKKPIDYFYNHLLIDLVKRGRDQNGKLISPKQWTVTFDINCTPIKVPELIIPNSGNLCRHFGTIDIGGTPILYYIYFTMQEILDAIRDSD
ncbi:translation initiation factor IF-2 N-terminal domain-containing protein [Geminocystis sp. CENA526]|uniref:translation initiation factor IF-2 N-terminal domain-containing protein n=1 Tax=Geminocystis sp. CENA526 TaxID=1355871 RepID=UPI003D6F293C